MAQDPFAICNSSGEQEHVRAHVVVDDVPRVVVSDKHDNHCAINYHVTNSNGETQTLSDDDSGRAMGSDYTGSFEGPEKTLEVVFKPASSSESVILRSGEISGCSDTSVPIQRTGLRRLSQADLNRICSLARCTILSMISNQYLDAYVLSESSLFIYPFMLVLKTCGKTTLLRCIATLIDLGRKLGLDVDWVGYSRKNFNFPSDQVFPHQSFHQELEYLRQNRNLCERLDGNGYTLGPVTGDHWFVFVADQTVRSTAVLSENGMDTDRVLNIMMFDIDETVAAKFTYTAYHRSGIDSETKEDEILRISKEQTVAARINELCPGAAIDARAFEPCGYSMNAILFRSYTTIHITPESGSSYASFETNQKVASYKSLISNVIRTFRPSRFVMTLMADEAGLDQVRENPLAVSAAASKIVVPIKKQQLDKETTPVKSIIYKRSSLASIKVEDDCCCMMGNWVLDHNLSSNSNGIRADKPRGMSFH